MISGVVLARNERWSIAYCLKRLRLHIDDVVFIDNRREDARSSWRDAGNDGFEDDDEPFRAGCPRLQNCIHLQG